MQRHVFVLLGVLAAACGDDTGGGGAADTSGTTGGLASGSGSTGATSTQSTATSSGQGSATTQSASATSSTSAASGTGGAGGGAPLDGYGALAGSCGDVDLEDVLSPDAELLTNALDLTGRPDLEPALLSPGGQVMYAAGNLNQSSLWSEVFAYEVLYRCEGAVFLKGEADIAYAIDGKKTDLLVEIDGEKVGVSVVRAVSFPEGSPYPVAQAYDVLEGKLADILQSTANVAPADAWRKQILSVVAQTPAHAQAIVDAYAMVDAATQADTIVVVTVTEGDDAFIYYNSN